MVRGDILLALAICETCPVSETDVMLPVMINIFETRSGLLALLKAVIDKEVSRTGMFCHYALVIWHKPFL